MIKTGLKKNCHIFYYTKCLKCSMANFKPATAKMSLRLLLNSINFKGILFLHFFHLRD